jgi:hypothetical protein
LSSEKQQHRTAYEDTHLQSEPAGRQPLNLRAIK